MKTIKTTLLLLVCVVAPLWLLATQPPVGGVFEGAWTKNVTNDVVDYCVWESTNGMVKWRQILETTNTWFRWTNNNITPQTFYAVTQIPRNPPGSTDTRRMSEMQFLHWAPSGTNLVTNANSYVRLVSVDVPVNQTVKVSSDLKVFEESYTFRVFVNGVEISNAIVRVENKTGALRPKFFTAYPTSNDVIAAQAALLSRLTVTNLAGTNRTKAAAIAPPPLP
jgi:hypothetical protein